MSANLTLAAFRAAPRCALCQRPHLPAGGPGVARSSRRNDASLCIGCAGATYLERRRQQARDSARRRRAAA